MSMVKINNDIRTMDVSMATTNVEFYVRNNIELLI